MRPAPIEDPFYTVFRGQFTGVLSWDDLDAFWGVVRDNAAGCAGHGRAGQCFSQ